MVEFAEILLEGRLLRLEYQWINRERAEAPLVVFLHEGLGSLSMWGAFPQRLCDAGGFRGLVYSRYGYGRSTSRPAEEKWAADYMHGQARQALPAFLRAVGVGGESPWLLGHSDGASIALIHAATAPETTAGAILLAPHIFVEDVTIRSIEKARDSYRTTDLKAKLARHHADPDSAFWGWNDAWLAPDFRHWNIEALLPAIRCCPLLAVQGKDDEYGTMAQVDGIERQVPTAEVLKLAQCGHAPHRDQPEALIRAVVEFVGRYEAPPA